MRRCFELAKLGAGNVAPNPMVGAVLVYNERIIGEGYHQQYGQAHAEVNCINSVPEAFSHLVECATLYVSLEPCAHFGKTPPCVNLIIEKKIPVVVIACRDNFEQVDGKGIRQLQLAGINVITPFLEKEAQELNKRFFTFHSRQRPYVILKWAQTANGMIASANKTRLLISNEITNREVHKWRSLEASILVGTNTALMDDPSLTNRLWTGNNPVRLVIDKALKVPSTLHLLDGKVKTIVFNVHQQSDNGPVLYYKISKEKSGLGEILKILYQLGIQSVLVEGGASLLQSFIDENYWDEARVITNTGLQIAKGLRGPQLLNSVKFFEENILSVNISYFKPL